MSSERKVWLPKTVAYILREWKKSQDELRNFLGEEYQDFNLVVALPNGRPCENLIIEKEFSLLKEKAGLSNVVFHSLRHSSTTYKPKGELKPPISKKVFFLSKTSIFVRFQLAKKLSLYSKFEIPSDKRKMVFSTAYG